MADFRRATNDFRMNLEREVRMDEIKDAMRPIENAPAGDLAPRVLAEPESPDSPADTPRQMWPRLRPLSRR